MIGGFCTGFSYGFEITLLNIQFYCIEADIIINIQMYWDCNYTCASPCRPIVLQIDIFDCLWASSS